MDDDGIVAPGKLIDNDDILVGKVQIGSGDNIMNKEAKTRDVSLRARRGEKGIVESVMASINSA